MIASNFTRRLLLSVALAAIGLAAAATAALGDARQAGGSSVFVGTFENHETISDTVPGDYPCFEGVTGTMTGTLDEFFRFNASPLFFHAESTDTMRYRIDFSDGRYVLGGSVEHFANDAHNGPPLHYTNTGTTQERATVYSADGQVTGTVMVHATFHETVTDYNENYQIEPGEVTASVDRLRVTCN